VRGVTCVEDLRAPARRRVPRAIFEYADRGSCAETTLAANRTALPVAIAPTGLTGLFHGDGEIHGARGVPIRQAPP